MEPKIIAFMGAGCAGKTTLFEEYRRRFDGDRRVQFAPEAAKIYFAAHRMAEELRFTAAVQGEIQAMALAGEDAACRQGQLVFSDRSIVDYPIYVSAIGDPVGAAELFDRARPWLSRYLHLYLLDPAGIPFEQTAERTEDAAMRQQLHDAFLRFLSAYDIPYTLLSGTVEDRLRAVDAALPSLIPE